MNKEESFYFASEEIAGILFTVYSSRHGIKRIFLNCPDVSIEYPEIIKLHPDDPFMFNAFQQLDEYFKTKRKEFSVLLDIKGTEFQMKVWNELLKIPYGKTVSYKTIAEKLGGAKYVRAVGKANATNPIPIIIPCHRVIGSNGSLGGYSGGIEIKEKLLELEGCISLELFDKI